MTPIGPSGARLVLATVLALATAETMAAAKIVGLTAKQTAAQEAQITITIERPTPMDMLCDTSVDLGDGSTRSVNFGMGDKHQKTLQHRYLKAGTYKVAVKATGRCEGARDTSVTVTGDAVSKAAAAKAQCPRGWTLAADSVKDNRYTCYANAPGTALKCEGGTQYFAEKGAAGCR